MRYSLLSLGSIVFLALFTSASPLSGLTITLTYVTSGQAGSVPMGDSDGARLMAVARAAADYWEDIIEDPHTLALQVRYNNAIPGIGKWDETTESGGRPTAGIISFKGTTTWYYDTTPTDHSEYVLGETLVQDLATPNLNASYGGAPPPLLEAFYTGILADDAPVAAVGASDLLSVALHEICHGLGMSAQLTSCGTEIQDGDFDVSPELVNGATFDVVTNTSGGAHTICPQCLMNPVIPAGRRRLPSASDVLALSTCPDPGWSDLDLPRQDFLPGGTTDWHTAGNWVGNQVPGAFDKASLRIGGQDGVANGVNIGLSGDVSCRELLLGESTDLVTNAFDLAVSQDITVEYDGAGSIPHLFVVEEGRVLAANLSLNGGELDMTGGSARIDNCLFTSADTNGQAGEITGHGIVAVETKLSNDGRIMATGLVGNTLSFTSTASAPWDLDGSGNGEVFATAGNLNFSTGSLVDSFGGTMRVHDPFTLNIGAEWLLAPGGKIDLNGGKNAKANLTGGKITAFAGALDCSLKGLITAPVDFGGFVEVNVFGGATLEMDSLTSFEGGTFTVGDSGVFELDGESSIMDGTFNLGMDSTLRLDGTALIMGGSFNLGTGATIRFGFEGFIGPEAQLDGAGRVLAAAESTVALVQGASLDCALVNEGTVVISSSPAQVSVGSYTQSSNGVLGLVLAGRPGTNNWDSITINGHASLAGTLNVFFAVPDAQIGDTWKIIDADSASGSFEIYQAAGVPFPPGTALRKFESDDGVYLQLTSGQSYQDLILGLNLPLGERAIDRDPDGDLIPNALELLLGGDPLQQNPGLLPLPEIMTVDGEEYLCLTVPVSTSVFLTDLDLRVTRSTGLDGWSSNDVVVAGSIYDPAAGVEWRTYRSRVPVGTVQNEYIRIEAGP